MTDSRAAMTERAERLLTVSETAKLWSVCERTVLRKIRSGELEVVMLAARAPSSGVRRKRERIEIEESRRSG